MVARRSATGVDGNRTHQAPRERRLNGFEGRCQDSQVLHSQELSDAAQPNDTKNDTTDPGLIAVVDAWPALPEALRSGILAMVRDAAPPAGSRAADAADHFAADGSDVVEPRERHDAV